MSVPPTTSSVAARKTIQQQEHVEQDDNRKKTHNDPKGISHTLNDGTRAVALHALITVQVALFIGEVEGMIIQCTLAWQTERAIVVLSTLITIFTMPICTACFAASGKIPARV